MRHTILWGGIAIICGLLACQPVTYDWKGVSGQFRIQVPSYLSEVDNMHDDAPLQMGDPYRSAYLLVRYDSLPVSNARATLTLEDHYIETFEQIMPGVPVPYPDSLDLGGLPALRIRTDSHHEGTGVVYDLTLVQGTEVLYQILSWTEDDEVLLYQPDQDLMVQSFEEL